MYEEARGVLDGPVSPCGHRNPPSAHFCDTCGVKLPMQCPCCSAINREQANFCGNCGMGLRDAPRTRATPSIVPSHLSTDSSPVTESQSPPAPPERFLPAKQAANGGMDGPDSDGQVPWNPESAKERLRQLVRVAQQRRRRAWVRLGTVSASIVVLGLAMAFVLAQTISGNTSRSGATGSGTTGSDVKSSNTPNGSAGSVPSGSFGTSTPSMSGKPMTKAACQRLGGTWIEGETKCAIKLR
jgi:hypothetical protein